MNIKEAHDLSLEYAKVVAQKALDEYGDVGACGFAWVEAKVDGRTKAGKEIKKLSGWSKHWYDGYYLWNPGDCRAQSVYVLERGAYAYVEKFKELTGIKVYAASRLD